MSKKSIVVSLAASIVLSIASLFSHADTNYYGDSLSFAGYTGSGALDQGSLTTIISHIETSFNVNHPSEIRLGTDIVSKYLNVFGAYLDVDLGSRYGAYLRGGFNARDNVYPYAIVGVTRIEVDAKFSFPQNGVGFRYLESESDVSFGVGVDVGLGRGLNAKAEYINYMDRGGIEIGGFSIGISKSF